MNEFLAVEAGERAPQRLRRRALELADDATLRLEQFQGDDPKAIHEIRRRFKELRALVRLVGAFLPHGGRPERESFRDAGRQFAPQRDAKAAVEAFDRLRERFAEEWTPRQFLKIRRALVRQSGRPTDPLTVAQLGSQIAIERGRIAAWPVDTMKPHDLWRALTRAYRAARRAMRAALREGTREKFHEWRRLAKVLWYQAQAFELLGMAAFEGQIKSLHKFSRTLGDHHDVALIDDLCRRTPESFGSPRYVRRFRTFLARRLRELEEQAESIGAELFAQRTRDWAAAVGSPEPERRRIGPKKSPDHPATQSLASA
jgi:CHAD domain-containing protein